MLNKAMFSAVIMLASMYFSNANAGCTEESCSGQVTGPIELAGVIDFSGDSYVFAIIDANSRASNATDDTCHYEDGTWLVARPLNNAPEDAAATLTAKAMQDVLSAGQARSGQRVMSFYYDWNPELEICVMTAIATVK